MASAATIEPPTHSPQVCDPVVEPVASAPTWMTTSSKTKARVAVPRTNQKRPRTSALLRFRDSTGPIFSLQITGIDSDQRVEAMRRTNTGRSQAPGAASGVNEPPAFTRMVYGVYESLDEAKGPSLRSLRSCKRTNPS
jgi:septal ring-binding cell division protein DamX